MFKPQIIIRVISLSAISMMMFGCPIKDRQVENEPSGVANNSLDVHSQVGEMLMNRVAKCNQYAIGQNTELRFEGVNRNDKQVIIVDGSVDTHCKLVLFQIAIESLDMHEEHQMYIYDWHRVVVAGDSPVSDAASSATLSADTLARLDYLGIRVEHRENGVAVMLPPMELANLRDAQLAVMCDPLVGKQGSVSWGAESQDELFIAKLNMWLPQSYLK